MENNTNVSTTAKTEIKIDPRPFPGDMKTDITTSIRLAETISSFFSGIFKDYSGCQIRVNDGHGYPSSLQYIPAGAVYPETAPAPPPRSGRFSAWPDPWSDYLP